VSDIDDFDGMALRRLLADDGHVDDTGSIDRFTEGALASLPAKRRRPRAAVSSRDVAVLGGALCAGAAGALAVYGGAFQIASAPLGGVLPIAVAVVVALWGLVDGAVSDRGS
jgi:hypothetical protein